MAIDIKKVQQKLESIYKDHDPSKDNDKQLLRREKHSLLVKGLPRPDNANRVQQPQIKEKISNALKEYHADPSNKEKLVQAQEKRHSSMDWEEHRKHNARINSDLEIVAKRRANHRKWQESEEGKFAYLEGRKKICKAVEDPAGKTWNSVQDAAPIWFPEKTLERAVKTIRYLIAQNKGWKYAD
jgi:hypothetical protein